MHKLIDSYNRHINYLRISVTDRCNLRCIYCMPSGGVDLLNHAEILTFEEIIRISRVAAETGISKIRITGGEPLVRKGISELITSLGNIPNIKELSMTTNGILLHKHAASLKKAGLERINISLDTLKPAKYKEITRIGDINEFLSGLKKAQEVGFYPIKINVVVMRGVNDDEITTFAKLTIAKPFHVRFIEFMPIDVNSSWKKTCFISNKDIKKRIEGFGTLHPVAQTSKAGPAEMFQLDGARGKIGFISALSNHFCSSCNRLRLTADGKLRTCLFSDNEIDLKTPIRQGIDDRGLADIITHAILSKPLKHVAMEPSFKKCLRGMSAIGG